MNNSIDSWDTEVKQNISNIWMKEILKKIQNNIFVYSIEWICLYTNDHLLNILSIDPVGKHLSEIFPHRSKEYIKKILADYKQIRETQQWDIIPVQKEKIASWETRIFSVSREPILWNGHPAIAGIGNDITEIFLAKEKSEKAEEELEKKNKELQEINKNIIAAKMQLENFVRHVAHDIRWPICAIMWYIEVVLIALEKGELTEKEREDFRKFLIIIGNSSESILSFIGELSDLSVMDSHGMDINKKEIPLDILLERLKDQRDWYIKNINNNLELSWEPIKNINIVLDKNEDDTMLLHTDPIRLERILTNLVNNAIKFTDQGYISVKVEYIQNEDNIWWYLFQISDTWIWIDEKYHQSIFQEFNQIESDSKTWIKWSGLWLSIVKKAINGLGWALLPIKSELGKWSTFSFFLPDWENK